MTVPPVRVSVWDGSVMFRAASRPGPVLYVEAGHTAAARPYASCIPAAAMEIHAIEAGVLRGNRTTIRGTGWSSVLRPRYDFEFPVYVYLIEGPDGHIAIDAGMDARGWRFPFVTRRFTPTPATARTADEVGPRMRAAGLQPEDVRTVVLTHLDVDHVGGVGWFSNAEVLVHRPEHEYARTRLGGLRYQTGNWPAEFEPTVYDMDPEPLGPFPRSKALSDDGAIRLVPIPGHSYGQVAAVVRTAEATLFFTADHMLRQDWFVRDVEAGRPCGLLSGALWLRRFRRLAADTTRRIRRFAQDVPTVVLPSHDSDAPRRLTELEPIQLEPANPSASARRDRKTDTPGADV